jgi:hypothetical protein
MTADAMQDNYSEGKHWKFYYLPDSGFLQCGGGGMHTEAIKIYDTAGIKNRIDNYIKCRLGV